MSVPRMTTISMRVSLVSHRCPTLSPLSQGGDDVRRENPYLTLLSSRCWDNRDKAGQRPDNFRTARKAWHSPGRPQHQTNDDASYDQNGRNQRTAARVGVRTTGPWSRSVSGTAGRKNACLFQPRDHSRRWGSWCDARGLLGEASGESQECRRRMSSDDWGSKKSGRLQCTEWGRESAGGGRLVSRSSRRI